jgi:hypothetical protein
MGKFLGIKKIIDLKYEVNDPFFCYWGLANTAI